MPTLRTVFLAFILIAMPAAGAAGNVTVTHLANEGFLIASGETKVLVDALFGNGLSGYAVVPAEARRQLETATDLFTGIDLVLATHHHGDHFEAEAVARHLTHNPEARFVSTQQAVERLRSVRNFAEIADRAEGYWPAEGATAKIELANITVTILNLHHGRGRQPPVQNLGFMIDIDGFRLLHIGDTEVTVPDIAGYALGEAGIDVLFAPSWIFTYDQWRPVLAEIDADFRVLMHLATPSAPSSYFGPDSNRRQRLQRIREADPEVIHLESMESRSFGSSPGLG